MVGLLSLHVTFFEPNLYEQYIKNDPSPSEHIENLFAVCRIGDHVIEDMCKP